ncbi:Rep [uncultured virus]|uniref:ATP-dependent helicase Rep n=1 Tax=uncultured virus TaxID=340016 RepID=A0A2K9LSF2_9VIRU|nr:Rep [uncultured virus]
MTEVDATKKKTRKKVPEHRHYCFTWNNWTEESKTLLSNYRFIRYCVYGEEIAPTTGTPHLQGYMQLNKSKTMSAVCKALPGISLLEPSERATDDQRITYCRKDGIVTEWGVKSNQGKRNDITDAMEHIEDGATELAVFQHHGPVAVKYTKGLDRYRALLDKQKCKGFNKKEVLVYFGKTGCGKTRKVMETYPDAFIVSEGVTGFWWTGYDGEEVVCIDEFRGNIPLCQFLRILDGYAVQVSVHGGTKYLMAKKIFITSNVAPWDWYPNCDLESKKALFRRFSNITEFTIDFAKRPIEISHELCYPPAGVQAEVAGNTGTATSPH